MQSSWLDEELKCSKVEFSSLALDSLFPLSSLLKSQANQERRARRGLTSVVFVLEVAALSNGVRGIYIARPQNPTIMCYSEPTWTFREIQELPA